MKIAHESVMSGHLGIRKTRDRILNDFWWPGIPSDVTRFCRSCDVCQKTVPKGTVPRVPLQRMPVIDTLFKRVAVDLVGPIYPPSDSGCRYILTLVDYATRYPVAVALKKVTAEDVAEAFVNMYSRRLECPASHLPPWRRKTGWRHSPLKQTADSLSNHINQIINHRQKEFPFQNLYVYWGIAMSIKRSIVCVAGRLYDEDL